MSKSEVFIPKKILLKMSGSIAAYKVCQIISKLVQAGHEVQVVTSPHAHHFIGNSTLEGLSQKSVISDTFAPNHAMAHIHLMRWADLIIAAPATANFINKIASGVGDDLLTTLFLAHDFKKPYLLAPAMNTSMYQHPITQQSLAKLKELSIEILETESGVLACGEVGWGRLLEPEAILQRVEQKLRQIATSTKPEVLNKNNSYSSIESNLTRPDNLPIDRDYAITSKKMPRVLITAGGTQEPIDSMRVLTNLSTGKTASRMAEYFYSLGMQVTVLAAESSIKPRLSGIQIYRYRSYADLKKSLQKLLATQEYDAVIHAAAVSDFSVSELSQNNTPLLLSAENKISSDKELTIKLIPNPKLLPQLKSWSKSKNTLVVGFKFTSSQDLDERKKAVDKLFTEGGIDLVVHNDSHDIDRSKKQHRLTLFNKEQIGSTCETPLKLYQTLAFHLLGKSADGVS